MADAQAYEAEATLAALVKRTVNSWNYVYNIHFSRTNQFSMSIFCAEFKLWAWRQWDDNL